MKIPNNQAINPGKAVQKIIALQFPEEKSFKVKMPITIP
jgi:hypothetical protein